jgi:hypothetical protein
MPSPSRPLHRAARSLLLTIAALVLLGWLLHKAPWELLRQRAVALPLWGWLLAAAGLAVTYLIRAARLRSEWSRRGDATTRECLRLTLAHNVALLMLPMRAGEAGYVWLVRRRWNASLAEATASLLWMRLQDAYVLGLIAAAALPPWPAPTRIALACSLLLLTSSLLPWLARMGRRRWSLLDRISRLLSARRNDATGWVCSVANWSLKLCVIGLLFAALAGLDASAALRAAVGGELAGALPIQAPAGLGSYELGASLAAGTGAVSLGQTAAAALCVHAFAAMVTVILAALVHVLAPQRRSSPATA